MENHVQRAQTYASRAGCGEGGRRNGGIGQGRGMAIIRLDPRYPLAWRTPTAIQIGGRRPLVVLDPVTTAEERMLAALRRGVPEEGLAVHGRCPQRDAEALLERVGPALLAPPPP